MKPLKRKLTLALVLFAFLSAAQLASAFYDPSLSRWLTRDPVEEIAFQKQTKRHRSANHFNGNLYWCAANSPVNKLDSWGLQISISPSCGEQEDDIRKAIKDSCDKAMSCSGCYQGAGAINNLCSSNPNMTIICRSEDYVNPDDPEGTNCSKDCGGALTGEPFIELCPRGFDPARCEGLECTIFHEAMHTGGERHGFGMSNFDQCMGCRTAR